MAVAVAGTSILGGLLRMLMLYGTLTNLVGGTEILWGEGRLFKEVSKRGRMTKGAPSRSLPKSNTTHPQTTSTASRLIPRYHSAPTNFLLHRVH
ncbi:hypothetical protein M405DRAFT_302237 [Rhizopogon salebrosus TDB-379]|nr:hypothetical protein M405DRAFT_302237 [Rhizopogon salebrosus TDB-379]